MVTLRRAAEQALAAIKSANQVNYSWACVEAVAALETALAEDALQRLTDVSQEIEAALAEPEQEPVAWMTHSNDLLPLFHRTERAALMWGAEPTPLYTAPPQRKPLTEEEVTRLIYENTKINPNVADDRELLGYIVNAARAIEHAHGIGEKT